MLRLQWTWILGRNHPVHYSCFIIKIPFCNGKQEAHPSLKTTEMVEALYTGTCEGPRPQQWGMFWISSLGGVALSDVLRKPWLQPLSNHFLTVICPGPSQVVLGGRPRLGQHRFHHQQQQYKVRGTECDFKVETSKAFIRLASWIFLAIQFLEKQPLDLFASSPFLMLVDTPKLLSYT